MGLEPGTSRSSARRANLCAIKSRFRGNGLAVESMSLNPEDRGSIPRLGSRRSLLISIEYAELLCSTLVGAAGAVRALAVPG